MIMVVVELLRSGLLQFVELIGFGDDLDLGYEIESDKDYFKILWFERLEKER